MNRPRRNLLSCSVLLLVLICLAAAALGALLVGLPSLAARTFGRPQAGLRPVQRAYLAARLLMADNDLTRPANVRGENQPFEIQLGESTYAIAARLEQAGLVPNAAALRDYLVWAGLDTRIQAGQYILPPGLTPLEIAAALQDSTPAEVSLTILPGWRIEEIAATLPTSGLSISPEMFRSAAAGRPSGVPFLEDLPPQATFEGFLFPGTYTLPRSTGVQELLSILLNEFEAQVTADLRDRFTGRGLTLFEAVTLASIVEREAVLEEEMPLIASVFLNRLAAGIKLDSDPTVQYALGFNSDHDNWWKNPLSLQDLGVDSPYNTYRYNGLPPGPIANPGLPAFQAVAFPAQTPYYYFRAACDGTGRHSFAETFEQHLQNECP